MTLKPQTANQLPEETARVAKAAFPKPNVSMRMRDEFGHLNRDETFAGLFSERG
jgi:transposase